MTLKSSLLSSVPGVTHGFGTREEPLPGAFREGFDERQPRKKQVHGVAIAEVERFAQELGEVDALWSRASGIPVSVVTADCVPILMARRDGRAVCAIHAGWRGTRAGIVVEAWRALGAEGQKPADWVAAIGPSIGPCCYEVSAELAVEFARAFPGLSTSLVVPRARHLDLPAINAEELRALGVGEVDLIRACTRCSSAPAFFSYRRDGSGHRQWSAIRID
jgi:polyphenol oxidase